MHLYKNITNITLSLTFDTGCKMKRHIFNRKPTPKLNKTMVTAKKATTSHPVRWSMSPTDALKVNYMDLQSTHK